MFYRKVRPYIEGKKIALVTEIDGVEVEHPFDPREDSDVARTYKEWLLQKNSPRPSLPLPEPVPIEQNMFPVELIEYDEHSSEVDN